MTPKSLLFVFLDGLGIGRRDLAHNPFVAMTPRLDALLGEGWNFGMVGEPPGTVVLRRQLLLGHIDPVMGVPGLPQSATGQCSLITGVNCQQEIGRHWGPRPNSRVREVIGRGTLFSAAKAAGGECRFAVAFPDSFFQALASGRRIPSSLQQAFLDIDGRLPDYQDLVDGKALSSDITGLGWQKELGYGEIPLLSPEAAADRLLVLAKSARFTLFEYWLSDHIGHRGSFAEAQSAVETLDRFLSLLLETSAEGEELLVLVTSDHGNLESMERKNHTDHLVPLLVAGPGAEGAGGLETISNVGRWMRDLLASD